MTLVSIPRALQLLLLFGRNSLLQLGSGLSKDEQIHAICLHRNTLRNQLYRLPAIMRAGSSMKYPLHERWENAPPEILALISLQVLVLAQHLQRDELGPEETGSKQYNHLPIMLSHCCCE